MHRIMTSVRRLAQGGGVRLNIAVVLFMSMGIIGCQPMQTRPDKDELLNLADRVEFNAFQYGSISVGAVRLSAYVDPNLKEARKKLLEHVTKLQDDAIAGGQKPELVQIRKTKRDETTVINVPLTADALKQALVGTSPLEKPTNQADAVASSSKQIPSQGQAGIVADDPKLGIDQLKDLSGITNPQPIASARMALASSQYLKSRLEDISLDSMFPVDPEHYRRVELSLALTAWTRNEARSALAYLDIYPFNGDIWCHHLVNELAVDESIGKAKETVLKHIGFLKGGMFRVSLTLPDSEYFPIFWTDEDFKKSDKDNLAGLCHAFLSNQHLTPKLVHVDSLDEGEFTTTVQRDVGNVEQKAGIGGLFGQSKSTKNEAIDVTQDIQFTSLAFTAGEHRAGYFFLRRGESGLIRPVEQRIRLVLDIPKDIERFEIHVHKTFFDRNDLPISTFGKQTHDAIEARKLVKDIEEQYPDESNPKDLFQTPAIWQLAKTRARNLYQQGWSERIIVFVPEQVMQMGKVTTGNARR